MRHDFLDRFSRLDSPIHRMPPGIKVGCTVALLVAIVTVPFSWTGFFAGAGLVLLLVILLSRIPVRFAAIRLLMFAPFVLGVALLTLLRPDGFSMFLSIVTKSTLCLLAVVLLSNTTPFARILDVLRSVRVPLILLTVLALMYRYVFVLVDEAERMTRARRSRTFDRSRIRTWHLLGSVIGQLFVRSTERAERIYAAMCARGWE
jgi:cobalt/nickel transport system permease protein